MATYEEWDECDACEGTGRTEGCVLESRCLHCQGHGSKRYIRCTECDSTGECSLCGGAGCEECKQTGACAECALGDRSRTVPETAAVNLAGSPQRRETSGAEGSRTPGL